jgi:hypothetical protein
MAALTSTQVVPLRRTALLWLHVLGASTLALTLLSRENLSLTFVFAGGPRLGGGLSAALVVFPVVLPYAVSFAVCRHAVPYNRSYTWLTAGIVGLGTIIGVGLLVRGISTGGLLLFAVALFAVLLGVGRNLSERQRIEMPNNRSSGRDA